MLLVGRVICSGVIFSVWFVVMLGSSFVSMVSSVVCGVIRR